MSVSLGKDILTHFIRKIGKVRKQNQNTHSPTKQGRRFLTNKNRKRCHEIFSKNVKLPKAVKLMYGYERFVFYVFPCIIQAR